MPTSAGATRARRASERGVGLNDSRALTGAVGRTRVCPHCKATILESAAVCPQCQHHLRFGVANVAAPKPEGFSALRVEGTVEHPPQGMATGSTRWC